VLKSGTREERGSTGQKKIDTAVPGAIRSHLREFAVAPPVIRMVNPHFGGDLKRHRTQ